MILVLLLVIGVVIAGVFAALDWENAFWGGIIFLVIVTIATVILWPSCYFTSLYDVANMETFYDVNKQNYEVTIDQTKEAVISLNSMDQFQIAVESMNQSTNWSERIKELREEVVEYNEKLRRLRVYNGIVWIDWFFVDPPEKLKVIRLER